MSMRSRHSLVPLLAALVFAAWLPGPNVEAQGIIQTETLTETKPAKRARFIKRAPAKVVHKVAIQGSDNDKGQMNLALNKSTTSSRRASR